MRVLELRNVSLTYPQSRFEKKKKMIADILYAIVILLMAGQAGGNAVSYIKKAGYLKGGLYGLKAAVKGTEVSNIIKNVVQDAVS